MAEDSSPQVFVVDQSTSSIQVPIRRKPLWKRARNGLIMPLFGVMLFGLVLEGIFIYRLHKRTEMLYLSQDPQQNRTDPQPPEGYKLGQHESLASNEILARLRQQEITDRPMAHLQGEKLCFIMYFIVIVGADTPGEGGLLHWVKNNYGFVSHLEYNKSGLVIKSSGFYYLYSKVHFQETDDCGMVKHTVFKNTTEYGLPITLMMSKNLHCHNERPNQKKEKEKEKDLWNSFLAGIFKLETGDHIYVTLDNGLYPGPADNFFGAFKMS
ncbi:hypothetical protein WMY93_006555 [Mugilogobius chulae]|uniref:THD domain-containing protein n=1 Tax=Mugilogobius chulae TaxID=88201 RepID=A0AAW0PKX0_9GOBI